MLSLSGQAATHYVDIASTNATPPFTNWVTAASNIQDAIDVCTNGEEILVADGRYAIGGRAVNCALTNRVAVTNAVAVRSVNGPGFAAIEGGGAGNPALRCVYLGANTVLDGFTLTNGTTLLSGLWDEVVGGGVFCDPSAIVSNCVIGGNSAQYGGGVYQGTFYICSIANNTASWDGGGANNGTLERCTLDGNSARSGGGAANALLRNCSLSRNVASQQGGGAAWCSMQNCTVISNAAESAGGVKGGGPIDNSIVYYNTAPVNPNYDMAFFLTACCTTPFPGPGNITNEPGIAGLFNPHLVMNSPCNNAGNNLLAGGLIDIDGEARIAGPAVDIGCDETPFPPGVSGTLAAGIQAGATNVACGAEVRFASLIEGRVNGYIWSLGEGGRCVTNNPLVSHVYSAPSNYTVVLTASNNSTWAAATVTVHVVGGYTNYVSLTGGHFAPFTNWATAATNIQDAVDANPVAGGVVLVAEGIYDLGARAQYGISNRVVIDRQVVVLASNSAPGATVILGQGPIGVGAIRCAYVGHGASLAGFTLSNGCTMTWGPDVDQNKQLSGGGAWCETDGIVSNCFVTCNSAESFGGGIYQGLLQDCSIVSNFSGMQGGGAYSATIEGGLLARNYGNQGGGASQCAIARSQIVSNQCPNNGAGVESSVLDRCVLRGNRTLNSGGGAASSTLRNCALYGNSAGGWGGAADWCHLLNCTIMANSSDTAAGGLSGANSVVTNCIVYHNSAPVDANYQSVTFSNSCTFPDPGGLNNITNEPGLLSLCNPHIVSNSPCVEAGDNALPVGPEDIDGDPRTNGAAIDIGCDEFPIATGAAGPLVVGIKASATNAIIGAQIRFETQIEGKANQYTWSFGDGQVASNRPLVDYAYFTPNTYTVILAAINNSGIGAATVAVHIVGGFTNYVSLAGGHFAPFTNWATAATNIQDAIDANPVAGGVVLVAEGVYRFGGRAQYGISNRVAIYKSLTVAASNPAPGATVIQGQGPLTNYAVRCAYVGHGARLAGFTLTNGFTMAWDVDIDWQKQLCGGGVWCEDDGSVSNCIIANNTAASYGGGVYHGLILGCVISGNSANNYGGGAYEATLSDCLIVGNMADSGGGIGWCAAGNCHILSNTVANWGGGAQYATLENCLVALNRAANGGGMYNGAASGCAIVGNMATANGGGSYGAVAANSIVYYNSAAGGTNFYNGMFTNCCAVPLPPGADNISTDPGLLGLINPHLVSNSPCIDAGSNSFAIGTTDLDGEPRIVNAVVDIGWDEFLAGGITGGLVVAILADYTNTFPGAMLSFRTAIAGKANAYTWDFDDGQGATNLPVVSHTFANPGDYEVVLSATNLTMGAAATVTVHVVATSTNYASLAGNHVYPFLSWTDAATNIQDAIGANCVTGGVVLVAPGVYDSGKTRVYGCDNRVAVVKPLTVRADNADPTLTLIVGQGPAGANAVRCAYVGPNAVLAGFTLTNGYTQTSGNLNTNRSGGGIWCESNAVVDACRIVKCTASYYGGGAFSGNLQNCTMLVNTAQNGGAVAWCNLRNSSLRGNIAGNNGGGAYYGSLWQCTLADNSAGNSGGAVYGADVQNSVIASNTAQYSGGGAYGGSLANSALFANSALYGGGAFISTLSGCSLVGNNAMEGGGAFNGVALNSLLYYNNAGNGPNYSGGYYTNCCTTPSTGVGCVESQPGIMGLDNPYLASNSPCIDAGLNSIAQGATDLEGEPRTNGPNVDIGCDEFMAGGSTGPLSVAIAADLTNGCQGAPMTFRAIVAGRAQEYRWLWGDSRESTNETVAVHAYAAPATYEVVLVASNCAMTAAATVAVHIVSGYTNYVSQSSTLPTEPFTSWFTAATNIQNAIDANVYCGGVVLVDRGIYAAGGRAQYGVTNRVAIHRPLTVMAADPAPGATVIEGRGPAGDGAIRCAYVGYGAALVGFTLTNGFTRNSGSTYVQRSGGGVWSESDGFISHCVLVGNKSAYYGGGIYGGLARNCLAARNEAVYGGGAAYTILENCTIVTNRGNSGGGTYGFRPITNSIVYFNQATTFTNYLSSFFAYSCSWPKPAGIGNTNSDPQFVDLPGGDYNLMASSPCRDAGSNQNWIAGAVDLDRKPRLVNSRVDMGVFELNPTLHRIVATATAGGAIDPAGAVWVEDSSNQTFTLATNLYFYLDDVTVDLVSTGAVFSYTFTNVVEDHAIHAVFDQLETTNGTPHWWLGLHGLTNESFEAEDWRDADGDGMFAWAEWLAGTDPTDCLSVFAINSFTLPSIGDRLPISFASVPAKTYQIWLCSNLAIGVWGKTVYATNPVTAWETADITGRTVQTTIYVNSATNPIFYRLKLAQ